MRSQKVSVRRSQGLFETGCSVLLKNCCEVTEGLCQKVSRSV